MRRIQLLRVDCYLAVVALTAFGVAAAPGGCAGTACHRYRRDGPNSTSDFIPTIGLPSEPVSRLPIRKLHDDQPDVFNMYLLAVESLMKKDPSDYMGWFDISGIHGYPYQPYQYPASSVVNPGLGYCTHHSVLFSSWHRPYLALLEQSLNAEAIAIAAKFTGPDAGRWMDAAKKLRLPYWDWADAGQQRLPDLSTAASLTVTRPDNSGNPETVDIHNPLLQYSPPSEHVGAIGSRTTRSARASALMASSFTLRKQQAMDLFAIADFNRFQAQLESMHDTVHVNVGGSMSVVSYAAFDPIFHLHHCNVDRLTAMYQNIWPDSTMTPGPRRNTLALGGGPDVNDTSTTPLYPFRHPDGTEWTSDQLKSYTSIFELGYQYPEVPMQELSHPSQQTFDAKRSTTRDYTLTLANQLYAPDGAASQTRTEYSAVVLLDTAEFTESCRVSLYLSNSDLVGMAPVFVGETIARQAATRVNTTVPLTDALKERGHESLDPKEIVPLLKDQLVWSIEKVASSEIVPLENIKSLVIAVYSREASYAVDEVPTKGESTVYAEITEGKQGGWKAGDPPILGVSSSPYDVAGS